ncbi:ABC transporter permease [Luethyella okanaganae]|uniref:FtsX-like permease family protein n=1 Tax=Luethyella okanaganae TaxID=69372 RepID=A0ABW1VDM5_9MICO
MSKYLNIKLLRDLRRYASQFVAVFLMALLSVLIYTGLEGAWNGLNKQLNDYAVETNLADIWVTTTGPDEALSEAIASLDGVSDVEEVSFLRATATDHDNTSLEVEVLGDRASDISRPVVTEGSSPTPKSDGIWLAAPFAEDKGIEVGDSIDLVLGAQAHSFTVGGIYYSSEKLYYTGTPSLVAPEHGLYSYALLPEGELAELPAPPPSTTVLRVATQPNDDLQDQIVAIAGDSLIRVTDRASNDAVSTAFDRVDQIRNLSVLFSFIFVLLAILAMYTSTRRLVDMQTREIAALKSQGFSARSIGTHFAMYGLAAGGLGALIGLLAAPVISTYVLSTQQTMLSMPNWSIGYTFIPLVVLGVVVLVCVLGAYLAARPALRGIPAEQLRPGIARGRHIFLERVRGLWERTSFGSRWAWRDSGTNPARFGMGIIAVAGSLMLLFAGFGMADSMNGQVESSFFEENTYTARAALSPSADLDELDALAPSGQQVQQLVVRTDSSDDFDRVVTVLDDGDYVHLETLDGNPADLNIVAVTESTADRLGISVGGTVQVTLPAGAGTIDLPIGEVIKGSAPQGFTMSRETWEDLGQEFAPTTLLVGEGTSLSELRERPDVSSVLTLETQRTNASDMVTDLGGIFMLIRVFAILLAIIVLYSLGALAFTERVRDYATLKVLGFTGRNLRVLASRENVVATVLGVLVGVPAGYWFLGLYVGTFSTARLEYTAQISLISIGIATLIAVFFSMLTTILLGRRIKRVDMVSALKGIE